MDLPLLIRSKKSYITHYVSTHDQQRSLCGHLRAPAHNRHEVFASENMPTCTRCVHAFVHEGRSYAQTPVEVPGDLA